MDTDWDLREQEMLPAWGHLVDRTPRGATDLQRGALIVLLLVLLAGGVVAGWLL